MLMVSIGLADLKGRFLDSFEYTCTHSLIFGLSAVEDFAIVFFCKLVHLWAYLFSEGSRCSVAAPALEVVIAFLCLSR